MPALVPTLVPKLALTRVQHAASAARVLRDGRGGAARRARRDGRGAAGAAARRRRGWRGGAAARRGANVAARRAGRGATVATLPTPLPTPLLTPVHTTPSAITLLSRRRACTARLERGGDAARLECRVRRRFGGAHARRRGATLGDGEQGAFISYNSFVDVGRCLTVLCPLLGRY
jgi:hypothetical protein